MADQNRNFRVRQHLGRHAPKHDRRNPAPAVRGHDDEIAASLLGGLNDGFVRMILFDLHGFADDASLARFFGDATQYLFRMRFGARSVRGYLYLLKYGWADIIQTAFSPRLPRVNGERTPLKRAFGCKRQRTRTQSTAPHRPRRTR